MSINIVADENIPYVDALFGALGNLEKVPGRTMSNDMLKNTDVLLVRSVTPVNEHLLEATPVKFVGTSTIGVDHLDTHYLKKHAISYASAPGCNAWAVVQYVVSVLASLDYLSQPARVGIVGGGNVGGRVYDTLCQLGFRCFIVDPFLDASCGRRLESFEELYSCDVICMHTPLTADGPHPTKHMFNAGVLSNLQDNTLLINAGRGGVINNHDLLQALENGSKLKVVLDVWENEPDIRSKLIPYVVYGTPHIAGYSLEGRLNGAMMIFERLCQFLKTDPDITREILVGVRHQAYGGLLARKRFSMKEAILAAYDVRKDDLAFRKVAATLPESFDRMRKHYHLRREFSHYTYTDISDDDNKAYRALRFADCE